MWQFEEWRLRGGGLPFLRLGKLKGVRYRISDLQPAEEPRALVDVRYGAARSMRASPKARTLSTTEGVVPRLRNFHGRTGKTESSNHADLTASG